MTESIQLHYHTYGNLNTEHPPVVLLHGLFGSWENLGLAARALHEQGHSVIGIDARNHGKSPHTATHSYPLMAADTLALIDRLGVSKVQLLGHSMGGKTAMWLALAAPERVAKLAVVDIAPRPYTPGHERIFAAMRQLSLSAVRSRTHADEQLSQAIEDPGVRAFILKNLYRDATQQWQWRLNLEALYQHYPAILDWPSTNAVFSGPTLLIRGGASDYVSAEDQAQFQRYFPALKAKTLANANHWPHATKPAVFQKVITDFF